MALLFAALLVLTGFDSLQGTWPPLRQVVQNHGIDASGLDDADRQITSYAVASEKAWFAIAYYWFDGTDWLPPELRIRTLDRRTGRWRHAILSGEHRRGGSVLRIARRPGVIYLDLHINPSAGELVVLSEDLKVKKSLYGSSSLILPDGRVVYANSMVHFAPAHPGSISLYDPRTGRDVRLYPATPDIPEGHRWIDRSILKVEQVGANRILITAREQNVLIGKDNGGIPDGPQRDLLVSCDLSADKPACTIAKKEAGRQPH